MRLLFLTDRLSHRGGAQHHLLDVVHAMANTHTVTVAASAIDSEVTLPKGVGFQKVSGLRSRGKSLEALGPLLNSTDIVHLQNVMNPMAIEQAAARPTVLTLQDHRAFCPGPGRTVPSGERCSQPMGPDACSPCLPNEERRMQMLGLTADTLQALKKIDRVVVLSNYMAEEADAAGLGKASVIRPPVKIGPQRESPGHGFLMAGRMVHLKGADVGYAAWAAAATDQPLRIAGLGSSLDGMSDAYPLGWLSRDQLRHEMAAARAVLFPARWQEPFGIVGAEALAMGTPVIALPTGGMADWCECGTIKVSDRTEMTSAIRDLATDSDAAHALGEAGRTHIQTLCSPNSVHAQLEAVYQHLIAAY